MTGTIGHSRRKLPVSPADRHGLPRRGQTENNSEAVIFRQGWWHSLGTGDTSLHKVPLFRGRVGVAPQKKSGQINRPLSKVINCHPLLYYKTEDIVAAVCCAQVQDVCALCNVVAQGYLFVYVAVVSRSIVLVHYLAQHVHHFDRYISIGSAAQCAFYREGTCIRVRYQRNICHRELVERNAYVGYMYHYRVHCVHVAGISTGYDAAYRVIVHKRAANEH